MKRIRRGMGYSVYCVVLFSVLIAASAWGTSAPPVGMEVGKPAIVCSATAACGLWAKEHPFDPETYGKVSGHSPVTSPDPKIALYTLSLDKDFFRLAAAVDAFVARNKGLERSVVQVIDVQGAQRGGYTASELRQRLEAVRKLAEDNKITHLSFVISASNAAGFGRRLGLADSPGPNLLIAHLGVPNGPADKEERPVVKWMDRYDTAKLADKAVQEIVASLEKSVGKK